MLSKKKATTRKTPEVQVSASHYSVIKKQQSDFVQQQTVPVTPAPPTPVIEEEDDDDVQITSNEPSSPSPIIEEAEQPVSVVATSSSPVHVNGDGQLVAAPSQLQRIDEMEMEMREEQLEQQQLLSSSPLPRIEEMEQEEQFTPAASSPFEELTPSTEPVYSQLSTSYNFNHGLSTIVEEHSSELALFFTPKSEEHAQEIQTVASSSPELHEPQIVQASSDMIYGEPLHRVIGYLHDLLARNPPATNEAQDGLRKLGLALQPAHPLGEQIVPSPDEAIAPVTPIESFFQEPSESEKPKTGGLMSKFTYSLSALSTPVTSMKNYFTGAKTQPAQKTAPLSMAKATSTPLFSLSRPQTTTSQSARLSPGLEELIDNILPGGTTQYQTPSKKPAKQPTSHYAPIPGRDLTFSAPELHIPPAHNSTLYDPAGNKIPSEYRNWFTRRIKQQNTDMAHLALLESEVACGTTVMTAEDQEFKDTTLKRQVWLTMWRQRQPGHRNRLLQVAGQKRAAEQISEDMEADTDMTSEQPAVDERSAKRSRHEPSVSTSSPGFRSSIRRKPRQKLPIGYGCPIPGDPNYRHVNEEMASISKLDVESTPAPSQIFGRVSGSTNNAPGSSEPSERTVGLTFAVPDDSDDDIMETEIAPPVVARSYLKSNMGNGWYGIPDDFSDSDSDEEVNVLPPAPQPAAAELPDTTTTAPTSPPASLVAPSATPFIHKYTPAKPSSLREVQTVASSPIVYTPPASPPGLNDLFDRIFDPANTPCCPPRNIINPDTLAEVDCTDLFNKMYEVYGPVILGPDFEAHRASMVKA
jgi:hypothetical protein